MPRYQTTLTWTEEAMAVVEFDIPEGIDPEEYLREQIPPLNNMKYSELNLVSAGADAVLN